MNEHEALTDDDRRRVLIVDDDEAIAVALRTQLMSSGLVVHLATEPAAAERLLAAHRYGVILVDAYMTGQLRERASSLVERVIALRNTAHVVLVSAYGSTLLTNRISNSGCATIVRKPVSIRVLADLVDAFLPPAAADATMMKGSTE